MTAEQRFERDLPELLVELLAAPPPDYRDHVLAETAHIRQRPRWTLPERWLPMRADMLVRTTIRPLPWRALAIVALLVVLLTAALSFGGTEERRLPPPFGIARNGLLAYAADETIYVADPATKRFKAIATGYGPQFAPDGTRLLFTRRGTGEQPAELIVATVDGGQPRSLGRVPAGPLGSIEWSPDGKFVLVSSKADGTVRLYDAVGSAAPRLVATNTYSAAGAFRPPDGSQVLLARTTEAGHIVLLADLVTPDPLPIVDVPGESALFISSQTPWSWAPDGARLAISMPRFAGDAQLRIFVVNADGTARRELTGTSEAVSETTPDWSPDGSRILYQHTSVGGGAGKSGWSIARVDGSGTTPVQVPAELQGSTRLTWSPDGRSILIVGLEASFLVDVASGIARPLGLDLAGATSWQRLAP